MLFEGSNHVQNFHINNSTNRNAIKLMNIQKIFNSCSKVKIIIFFTSKAQACCSILQLFINVLDIAMPHEHIEWVSNQWSIWTLHLKQNSKNCLHLLKFFKRKYSWIFMFYEWNTHAGLLRFAAQYLKSMTKTNIRQFRSHRPVGSTPNMMLHSVIT